ncbi:MAG: SET domain-containing protein-lysine N-methyltransferase [Gammaproteobacteria bacterium]|nr:SET domain-containing protein-lysine N-methyltransferase [Gammaproteobacteria bacterium]
MNHTLYPRSFLDRCKPSGEALRQLPSRSALTKRTTEECGVGIYARRPFHRGELIGSFLALEINEVNQHSLQRAPGDYLYDPYFVGYLLHSCDPNVVLDMHQQTVYCLRNIAAGEPLMMDYASTEDSLFRQFPCACGAPNCRQWVTGRAEPVNSEGWLFLTGQLIAPPAGILPAASN